MHKKVPDFKAKVTPWKCEFRVLFCPPGGYVYNKSNIHIYIYIYIYLCICIHISKFFINSDYKYVIRFM